LPPKQEPQESCMTFKDFSDECNKRMEKMLTTKWKILGVVVFMIGAAISIISVAWWRNADERVILAAKIVANEIDITYIQTTQAGVLLKIEQLERDGKDNHKEIMLLLLKLIDKNGIPRDGDLKDLYGMYGDGS